MLEHEGQWGIRRQIDLHYHSPRRGELLGVKPTEGRFAEPEQVNPGADYDAFDVSGMRPAGSDLEDTILGMSWRLYFFGTRPGSSSWLDSTFHVHFPTCHQVYFCE